MTTLDTKGGFARVTGTEARVCELIAARHGRWTLISQVQGGKHKKWKALCDCGKEKIVFIENLVRGKSVSCGCFRGELSGDRVRTHGQSGRTNTYRSWSHMKGRCLNETDAAYGDYGGRGISICDRWMTFEMFFEDMGHCPSGFSIERIDVNKGYEPSNCKWIKRNLQPRNTRATRFTEPSIKTIRQKLSIGAAPSSLALEYGVSSGHIRQIKNNKIWIGV